MYCCSLPRGQLRKCAQRVLRLPCCSLPRTGLGLTALHDMVVRDLGGTIEVDTKVGEGTTFKLRFVRPPNETG
jgi:signal transduction histidine kinase